MRIVDPWMNADMPEWGDEPWMLAVAERYLGSGKAGLRRLEAAELLEATDRNGVERAILDLNLDRPPPTASIRCDEASLTREIWRSGR
jgi:hypothetical protein